MRVLLVWACLLPLFSANAAGRYRVTLATGGDDHSAIVAKRLTAAYHGQLVTPVDESGTFDITLSAATAELLARDPQVARLEALVVAPAAATSWSLGTFEYDDNGNIKKVGTSVFVYDSESRISYETVGTQTRQAVTYDGFGNIRTITEGSKLQFVGADVRTNRADVAASSSNYIYGTYDDTGNMITSVSTTDTAGPRTYTYTWDALNVMTKATTDVSRAYVYNANDERIGVIALTGPNGTELSSQWTIRDPAGQVLRRFSRQDGQWRWMQDYIYRDGKMLASESNDQIKTLHYHLDHLGTPRLITGNGGAEIARHTYYPFGEEVPAPMPQVAEPKKFTGHERDSGGLDYMHARYYDYSIGRFLSVDPASESPDLANPQSWNRYSYAGNNALIYIDPDGRAKRIYILQSFGWDNTKFFWGDIKRSARNGYTVDPERSANRQEILGTLSAADNTDFVVTHSHGSRTAILQQRLVDMSHGHITSRLSGADIASAVNHDSSRPAAIALLGCSTQAVAREVATHTGVPTVGTTGVVVSPMSRAAMQVLTAYFSARGRIDEIAIRMANAAADKVRKTNAQCQSDPSICVGRFILEDPKR